MSKTARAVAAVVVTAAAILTLNPQLIQAAVSMDLALIAGELAPKRSMTSSGTETRWSADPNAGIPYAVGRCAIAGDIRFERSAGSSNKYKNIVSVYSVGPIQAFQGFYANGELVSFGTDSGEGASGYYQNRMWQKRQLGAAHEPYLHWTATGTKDTPANHGGMPTDWTSAHKLSGYAASLWGLEWDTAKYSGGVPPPWMVGQWVKAYDPRKDSTYPGGSGPQRYAEPSNKAAYLAAKATWSWTANPYIHALAWGLGVYTGAPETGDPLVQTHGFGLALSDVDVATFIEGANVADANSWGLHTRVYSTDDKWEVLKGFLEAGAGEPIMLGDRLSCLVNTPKVSLATITGRDAVGEVSLDGTAGFNERINTVWPSWTIEELGWEVTPAAAPVQVAAHVTEDQGVRSRELSVPQVQSSAQVGALSRYMIEDSRELPNIVLPLGPAGMWLQPGMCITANEPEWGLNGQKLLILKRQRDPATMVTTLVCRTETDAKHAFALGQTATPPSTPRLTGVDPNVVPLPAGDAFEIIGGQVAGPGGTLPAIVIAGEADLYDAVTIVVDYRRVLPLPVGEWRSESFPVRTESGVTRTIVIKGVEPGATYQVRIRYITASGVENPGSNVDLGTIAVSPITAPVPPDVLADIEAAQDAADAAQLDADAALTALFDPTSGALVEIDTLQTGQATHSSQIAVLQTSDVTTAGKIVALEAGHGGNNRQPNPRFASGFDYWPIHSAQWSTGDTTSGEGTWALFSAGGVGGVTAVLYGDMIPWGAGLPIGLSGRRYVNGITSGVLQVYVDCFDATGTSIPGGTRQATTFYNAGYPAGQAAGTQDWTGPLSQTTPAGTTQVRIKIEAIGVSASSFLGIYRVMLSDDPRRDFADDATMAKTVARVTSTEVTTASNTAAIAATDTRVGVSMQQGSYSNANARMGAYTTTPGYPDGWAVWTGAASRFSRQAGEGANYAVRAAPAAAENLGISQSITLSAGDYLLTFEGKGNSGDWSGAGLLLSGPGTYFINCLTDKDLAGLTGAGSTGVRRWSKIVTILAGTYTLYSMHGYTSFGTITAKSLDIYVAGIQPLDAGGKIAQTASADATSALISAATANSALAAYEVTANARLDGLDASATTQGTAISNLQGRTASWLTKVAAAGADPAYIYMQSDATAAGGADSYIALVAKSLFLYNTVGGTLVQAMAVTGGNAYFPNNVYVGPNSNLQLQGPNGRIVVIDGSSVVRVKLGNLA